MYPFKNKIGEAVELPSLKLNHVKPCRQIQEPLSAPVTENVYWYFAADSVPLDFGDTWENFIQESFEVATEAAVLGESQGWVEEEVELKSLQGEDIKGRACACFIGWQSVQHHMNFRETGAFKKFMPNVLKLVQGAEMVSAAVVLA